MPSLFDSRSSVVTFIVASGAVTESMLKLITLFWEKVLTSEDGIKEGFW